MAIRFQETDVRPMGRTAYGVRGITLRDDDYVVAMEVVKPGGTLLTVTERGYGKRTEIDEYRVQSRGGVGVINISTSDAQRAGRRRRLRAGGRRAAGHHAAGHDPPHADRRRARHRPRDAGRDGSSTSRATTRSSRSRGSSKEEEEEPRRRSRLANRRTRAARSRSAMRTRRRCSLLLPTTLAVVALCARQPNESILSAVLRRLARCAIITALQERRHRRVRARHAGHRHQLRRSPRRRTATAGESCLGEACRFRRR